MTAVRMAFNFASAYASGSVTILLDNTNPHYILKTDLENEYQHNSTTFDRISPNFDLIIL